MLKKNDIIERMTKRGYTKKDAATVLRDVFDVVSEGLAEGESVRIHGFGTFCIRKHKPRKIIDLNSGKEILVPAYNSPAFTAGILLRRAVKGEGGE